MSIVCIGCHACVALSGTIPYDTIPYDTIPYDTIPYDTIQNYTIQCDAI